MCILRAISDFEKFLSFIAASTWRARTRLMAVVVTSSRMPSSLNQLSKDDPMFSFSYAASFSLPPNRQHILS